MAIDYISLINDLNAFESSVKDFNLSVTALENEILSLNQTLASRRATGDDSNNEFQSFNQRVTELIAKKNKLINDVLILQAELGTSATKQYTRAGLETLYE